MNNIVYIPAFNNFIAWFPGVRESWKQYCAEHELALFIDTKKIEPFAKYMPWWVHGCYYKFLNNDIYNKNYDQILLVDCDIIVSPNAPNIFDLGKIEFAARADINEKAKHVWYQQLVEVDPYIPGIDTTYFNVGVCYMSQETYNMLYESILPYYVHDAQQQLKFGKGPTAPDQTPVNQKIHKAGLYTELDPRWNNMVLAEGWDSNAYCWHFAGVPHEKKYEIMKDAWNILRDSY